MHPKNIFARILGRDLQIKGGAWEQKQNAIGQLSLTLNLASGFEVNEFIPWNLLPGQGRNRIPFWWEFIRSITGGVTQTLRKIRNIHSPYLLRVGLPGSDTTSVLRIGYLGGATPVAQLPRPLDTSGNFSGYSVNFWVRGTLQHNPSLSYRVNAVSADGTAIAITSFGGVTNQWQLISFTIPAANNGTFYLEILNNVSQSASRLDFSGFTVVPYGQNGTRYNQGEELFEPPTYELLNEIFELEPIELYIDGVQVVQGVVRQVMQAEPGFIRLLCDDALGYLTTNYSRYPANYNGNNRWMTILQDILIQEENWILFRAETVEDQNTRLVRDLTNKESVWAQLVAAVESIPGMYLRYEGYAELIGKHVLGVGTFGTRSGIEAGTSRVPPLRLDESQNILEPPQEQTRTRPRIKYLFAIGGTDGNGNRIKLNTGITTQLSDYPIVEDVELAVGIDSNYVIENTLVEDGYKRTIVYPDIATTATTAGAINNVRQALYYRGVRELRESAGITDLNIKAVIDTIPKIGDMAYVRSRIESLHFDPLTEQRIPKTIRAIADYFKVTGITIQLEEGYEQIIYDDTLDQPHSGVKASIALTDGEARAIYDDVEYLLKKTGDVRSGGNEANLVSGLTPVVIQVTHSAVAADYEYKGKRYKLFTFPSFGWSHSAPVYVTAHMSALSNPSVECVLVSWFNQHQPASDPTGVSFNLAVSGQNGRDWTTADSVTIDVIYSFISDD